MDATLTHLALLCLAALFAGLVDAIAGGGGLIQVPALLLAFPGAPVALLLGTNKLSSICGTAVASAKYLRHVKLALGVIIPSAAVAFVASSFGAWTMSHADPQRLKPLIALLLTGVLAFVVFKPGLGGEHLALKTVRYPRLKGLTLAAVIGFYDGFLGPGAGGFFVFGGVLLLGMSFLEAGAQAKVLNLSTNAAAAMLFASKHLIAYQIGLPMAASNILGGYVGSHLAITRGSQFVRRVFVVVVGLILIRLVYDLVF